MNFLTVLLIVLMLATAAVLLVGIGGFIAGGRFNERWGNRMMRARVGLQFAALLVLGLLLATHG